MPQVLRRSKRLEKSQPKNKTKKTKFKNGSVLNRATNSKIKFAKFGKRSALNQSTNQIKETNFENGTLLKFKSVIIKEKDSEFIVIPKFPDLRIRITKRGKHPYMCNKCNLGFWSKKAYDAHTPIHILKKVKRPVMKFRCDVCLKEFGKLCDVERHMRVHTGEKPCVCNICNKRFQQSHNLSKHLLTHLYIKPYHCEICNKQFGRNDVLNRHLLTHSMEKPIKCSVCAKGFIRQTQLNQHLKTHHPDVPLEKSKASGNPNVITT